MSIWLWRKPAYEETLRITNNGCTRLESGKGHVKLLTHPKFFSLHQFHLLSLQLINGYWHFAEIELILYCTLHLFTVQYNTFILFINREKKKNYGKLLNFGKRKMQLGGALWNGLQFHFYTFMAHYSASKEIHAKGHGA